jgi:hypothetical protein
MLVRYMRKKQTGTLWEYARPKLIDAGRQDMGQGTWGHGFIFRFSILRTPQKNLLPHLL